MEGYKDGPPPCIAGEYDVVMKNGDTRTVVRRERGYRFCLEFCDCTHPLQNILCHEPDIIKHKKRAIHQKSYPPNQQHF